MYSASALGSIPVIISSFYRVFRQLPSELTERNLTKLCHMFESELAMKMHVQNLRCPLPLKLGPQNYLCSTSQLNV